MRNLVVLNKGQVRFESQTYPDLQLVEACFDVITDSITAVLTSEDSGIVEVQQCTQSGQITVLASFPVSNAITCNSGLLSFIHFLEFGQLVFVLENGDIIIATYDQAAPDCDTTMVEIVGSFDLGVEAASWSCDEETLALMTKDHKIVLLSRSFDPISECVLNHEDIMVVDSKHVSVGWGKKETQFKGKGFRARERDALKHAGLDLLEEDSPLRDPTVAELETGTLSDSDNLKAKISWRGDSQFFAVTAIEQVLVQDTHESYDRRVIRVYDREGVLDSVSEAVDGLTHNLAWKPQGAVYISTQQHIDQDGDLTLDCVFFERNGLRRGHFNSRLDPTVDDIVNIEWSCDSEVVLLQLKDRVQVWTTKNYHWYLKQEIHCSKVVLAKFHPEKPLHMMLAKDDGTLDIVDFSQKIVTGPTSTSHDIGMTLVADGSLIKVTPLSIANVPPPISFREIDLPENITDLAVSQSNEMYAAVSSFNNIFLSKLKLGDAKNFQQPQLVSSISSSDLQLSADEFAKQISFIGDSTLAILCDTYADSRVMIYDVSIISQPRFVSSISMDLKVVLLKADCNFGLTIVEQIDGSVYSIDQNCEIKFVTKFPQLCRDIEAGFVEGDSPQLYAFGFSSTGKLFANEKQISSAVTSIKVTDNHLLFTNVHSLLCFVHLNSAELSSSSLTFEKSTNVNEPNERVRLIERGSFLVNVMPSQYAVVLEAPRGNIETIYPRIMVVSGVRKFIASKQYREAFVACRTHRIDLDILHDYDPVLFFKNIDEFVAKVEKVEYLDLFVSCLHDEDVTLTKYRETLNETTSNEAAMASLSLNETVPASQPVALLKKIIKNNENVYKESPKINRICEAILAVLLRPDYRDKYLQTILTAYACERPPKLEEALSLASSLPSTDRLEEAVIHLCFLQDVNLLYSTALGLYNIRSSLLIAQQSQKDPKEYLPFLQNLLDQDELRRKFLIDDFLKKYEKALHWLFEMGSDAYDEYDRYVVSHDLYKCALVAFKYDSERCNLLYRLYADYMSGQRMYSEAAMVYEFLGDIENASEYYILGKNWKEAISLLQDEPDKLVDCAERLVSSLTEDHRYCEVARIEHLTLGNTNEAIKFYCKGYAFDEAILLARSESKPELIESIVDVYLGEGFSTIAELLADCKGQMNSQLRRLRELREKKLQDPYAFYGMPADDLDAPDDVSIVASETSTAPSFFTRYTGKTSGTAKTGASRRTAKNKKREERKRAKGRKGTIYEEEYLITSVGRLLDRLKSTQSDGVKLIEGLVRRGMKEQAYQIQLVWGELLQFIEENAPEIYAMSERDRERIDDNGEVYLIDEIPIPKIEQFPKKLMLDY